MAATYDGSIRINTKIDSAGAKAELASLTKSLKTFALTVGVAFGVGAVVNFGKSCVNLASDLSEVQNVIDTTFGNSVGLIEDFADTAATSFGLSELAAKQYTGTLGAMLKSMGFATDQAADMSIEMAGLAGDLASFYNLSTDEAFQKIRSGISGETEPLKQLGVNLSVANLQAYALAQGMATSYDALSEQSKALLRYNYLLDVTSDAQGDFAKTSNSWANQVRILQMQWESFKASMGRAFIVVLTPVLRMLNILIGQLNAAATVFANFVSAITGTSQKITTATSEAADSVDDLTDSTVASGEAAKKATGQLAGFDELNVISSVSGSSTAPAIELATTSTETDDTTSAFGEATEAVENFKSAFDFTNLQESLTLLKESFTGFKSSIGSGLKWIYDNILVPFAAWTIEDVVPAFIDVLSSALGVITAVIEALKPLGIWLWDSFLEPLSEWTGGIIVSVLGLIAVALGDISDWAKQHKTTMQVMTVTVGTFLAAWKTVELLAFIQMSGGIVGALAGITTAIKACTIAKIADKAETIALQILYAKDFVASIGTLIVKKAEELIAWGASTAAKVADNVATLALMALYAGDFIVSLASVIATKAKELAAFVASTAAKVADTTATTALSLATGIATAATTAFSVALAFLAANPIVLVIAAIAALVAGIALLIIHWDTVKTKASEVWDSIVSVWGSAAEWFNTTIVTPIADFFGGLWTGIKSGASTLASYISNNVISPIVSLFKGLYNSLVGIMEGVINGFVKIINSFVFGINSVMKTINKIPGVSLPMIGSLKKVSIPRLAQGAVIPPNREFMAVLGDQKSGTNIEAPLDTIVEAVKAAFAEMGSTTGGVSVNINFSGSLAQLGRVLQPVITVENNRKGTSIIPT